MKFNFAILERLEVQIIMLKFLTFLIFFITFNQVQAKDNNNRLSVGLGIFNYMEDGSPPHHDQSGMINLELHSGRKMFNLIKPFAGFLGTNENAYYAYGGFGIDGYYGKKKNFVVKFQMGTTVLYIY